MKTKYIMIALLSAVGCKQSTSTDNTTIIKPAIITEPVLNDSDDPAIWINKENLSESLIIGTDKGGDQGEGALYVFNLEGKILKDKTFPIKRANNVDIAYHVKLGNQFVDIAICTERNTNSIRVFSLPDLRPIDNGGIAVFEGDSLRAPMGISLYQTQGTTYAIVGRKNGTSGTYLWQYELQDSSGFITGKVVRKFGNYSGRKEIESIAVDHELGYVYYSDEGVGVRKYYAHPDSSNIELALFATTGFAADHEGISIYQLTDSTGYILVSDQQANHFKVFTREGTNGNPHQHALIKSLALSTTESDGSEVTSIALPGFAHGLFVAMCDDKTFQIYRWEDLAGGDLKSR
ncbi:phytase [Pseudochryseolinea flava]|uniref:3-phytase n=1 Tax=Pseudochryseolinea flava TaxID=2059302 RepID=A0A364Y222_9BACT|nr:phytase [Pseudochryseolinea flava]RAW00323.1 3-phytase [Pseudochryseolinea flava]